MYNNENHRSKARLSTHMGAWSFSSCN